MRRILLAAACIALVPVLATAQTYTASLSGDTGSGFGNITISGDTINYNILVSGITPTSASLTDGSDTIDLGASFTGGSAAGSTTSSLASDVASDPASWTLNVNDGALSGPLSSGGSGAGTEVYFPVSVSNPGQAGSFFRTDVRIVNRSSAAAEVTIDYYRGANGGASTDASETVTVAANEQLVLNDFLQSLFGFNRAQGGVMITSDTELVVTSRVFDDQRASDGGTKGLFVNAVGMDAALQAGTVAFLQNQLAGSGDGFRGSIGWFNPNSTDATVTVSGWDTDGTLLGSATVTGVSLVQDQEAIDAIWPALAGYGDMYVTFVASQPIFVYGTITDNVTNDGTYIPAK
jgi:hypothetical protein